MARPSSLKPTILNFISENHLLSANKLVSLLHDSGKPVNKTSVYRNLEQLLEEGVICQHIFDNKESVYELRNHHHDHLVCDQCGKIEEATCHVPTPTRVGKFRVGHHHMTLYGVCASCS